MVRTSPVAARLLRLLRAVSLIRGAEPASHDRASEGWSCMLLGAQLLAFCGALAVLDAERANPDANITNFGDAVW